MVFDVESVLEPRTIEEYLRLPSKLPNQISFVTIDEKATIRSEDRLILLACTHRQIPVLRVKPEFIEIVRKIANKFKVRLVPIAEIPVSSLFDQSVRSKQMSSAVMNIERFLYMKASAGKAVPVELPLILQEDGTLVLNEDNNVWEKLGPLAGSVDRIRKIYWTFFEVLREVNSHSLDLQKGKNLLARIGTAFREWADDLAASEDVIKRLELLEKRWWESAISLKDGFRKVNTFRRDGKEYFGYCFIVCPFSSHYKDVIKAIKDTASEFGVLAEAADAIDNIDILKKICLRIDKCDFAVVDITLSNPNVLLELGLLIARRKPAFIIRNKDRAHLAEVSVPADIIGIERIEYENVSEDLTGKLRKAFAKVKETYESQFKS